MESLPRRLGLPQYCPRPRIPRTGSRFHLHNRLEVRPRRFRRPKWLSTFRNSRRQELLEKVRKGGKQRFPKDEKFSEYDAALQEASVFPDPNS